MGDHKAPRVAGRWSDLGLRALSAAVLAPVALLCIWFGGIAYALLIVAAGLALAAEWVALCSARVRSGPGLAVAVPVLLSGLAAAMHRPALGLVLLALGGAIVWIWTRRPVLAAGVAYIGIPLVALLWLRGGRSLSGREDVLVLVLLVWASDIGAYLVGRLVRGPKLAPALSPGKTWSGATGGLAAVAGLGWIVSDTVAGCLVALLLGVVCQAGDLLESGIKRHFGVKDSGRLIPGHGGLLDRLDGLLAAAPVAALVVLGGRGGQLWH